MRLQSGRMEDQRATVPPVGENRLSSANKTAGRKDKKKWLMFSAPSSIDY